MRTPEPTGPSKTVATRDFVVFQIKLAVDGVKDLLVFNLSIVAILIDLIVGGRRSPRWFYGVVRASRNFDAWLRLHATKGERRSPTHRKRSIAAAERRAGERGVPNRPT